MPAEQQRVVPELHVRGPGDHVPEAGQARVGASAPDIRGEAEPGAIAVLLEQGAERHVVDQRALERCQAAGLLERGSPDEHAAAGRRGGTALRVIDPAERVELGEEVDEGGHDHPLPAGLRAEQGHLRDEGPVVGFRALDQVAERGRRPGDVRVGEQHVVRRGAARGHACRPGRRPAVGRCAPSPPPGPAPSPRPCRPSRRALAGPLPRSAAPRRRARPSRRVRPRSRRCRHRCCHRRGRHGTRPGSPGRAARGASRAETPPRSLPEPRRRPPATSPARDQPRRRVRVRGGARRRAAAAGWSARTLRAPPRGTATRRH